MVELIRRSESVVPNGAFFWREVMLCVGGGGEGVRGRRGREEKEGERERKEEGRKGRRGKGRVREGGR